MSQMMQKLEALGNQKNVVLTVQPTAYEAIEFLYQVVGQQKGHFQSYEKELFWESIEIKYDTPKDVVKEISSAHHKYLCDIIEHRPAELKRYQKTMARYKDYLVS